MSTPINWLRSLDLMRSFINFPIASILAINTAAIAVMWIDNENDGDFLKYFYISFMSFLTALAAQLISRYLISGRYKILLQLGLPVLVATAWYFYLPRPFSTVEMDGYYPYPYVMFGWIAIMHLLVAVIPYFHKSSDEDVWEYNRRLFTNFIQSGIFTIIIFVGLAMALVALNQLFNVDIKGTAYLRLFMILTYGFSIVYFLSIFPVADHDSKIEKPHASFLVLVKYILVPIAILYLIILTAYGARIAILQELPRGWVGQLSIWFSVVAIAVWLLNYFIPRFSNNKLSYIYKKYAFAALIVPIVLLVVATKVRIDDYGVTENRYILVALTVWLAFITLIYLLRSQIGIKWIPISLIMAILISISPSPINMFQATLKSQAKRLSSLLVDKEKNGYEIREIVDAFARRNALISMARNLPEYPIDFSAVDTLTSNYDKVSVIIKQWDIDDESLINPIENQVGYYYINTKNTVGLDIANFNRLAKIEYYQGINQEQNQIFSLHQVTATIMIGEHRYAEDLLSVITRYYRYNGQLDVSDVFINFTDSEGNLVARLYIENMSGTEKGVEFSVDSLSGLLVFNE